MILVHDAMTCLPARHKFYALFSAFWRTQSLNFNEYHPTYDDICLDIRIRWSRRRQAWVFCHGIVDLSLLSFDTVFDVMLYIKNPFVRIILERGNKKDEERFRKEVAEAMSKTIALLYVIEFRIKRTWECVYIDKEYPINAVNLNYEYWDYQRSFWKNISRLLRHHRSLEYYSIEGNKAYRPNQKMMYSMDFVKLKFSDYEINS